MGRKQSPFIGKRVPLVDEASQQPILYARYTAVAQILVDGAAGSKRPAPVAVQPAAAGADVAAAPPAKKQKAQQQQQPQQAAEQPRPAQTAQQQPRPARPAATAAAAENADDAHAPEPEQQQLSKKELKKLKKQQRRQQPQQAAVAEAADADADGGGDGGPAADKQEQQQAQGNAQEAARIRQVLGFTNASTPAAAAAAPAPAAAAAAPAAAAPAGGFSFNFSGLPAAERVEAETQAKLAAIAAVTGADKDGFVPRRVFVGGMPYSYSREQVEEYWGWCGAVESLDIMTFPDTGRFKGIAFVTFTTQEGYEAALACDGEQLDGQTLKVERCKAAAVAKHIKAAAGGSGAAGQQGAQSQSQRARQQQQYNQAAPPASSTLPAAGPDTPSSHGGAAAGGGASGEAAKTPGYNVAYVGNICFEARTEDISALFEACAVTKVRLHTDKDTRKSRGYAHVHFGDEAGLDRALAMSGTEFMGRAIKVSYAQPKRA